MSGFLKIQHITFMELKEDYLQFPLLTFKKETSGSFS